MLLIDGRDNVYMINSENNVFKISDLHFPSRKDSNRYIKNTLLDGVSF